MNFTKDKLVLSRNDAMTFIDKRLGRTVLKQNFEMLLGSQMPLTEESY